MNNQLDQHAEPLDASERWTVERFTRPAKLRGANGMRFGPDGRLHVVQAMSSEIAAIDLATGAIENIVNVGDGIYEPDDLDFDSHGTLYATEIMEGRVSVRKPNGKVEVFAGDLPGANGISIHNDRIFIDECRSGGRLWELSPSDGSRRLIAENLPAPNALYLGPDDYLYFPVIFGNEIWRVPVVGGEPEVFVGDIQAPVAVKFDSQDRLVTVSSGTGDVLRYDLPSRQRVNLGRTRPGIDNFAIDKDDSVFVSHFTDGGISQLRHDGSEHVVVEAALPTPWGIAFDHRGDLIIADGLGIMRCSASGASSGVVNLLTDHDFPSYARNLVVLPDGSYVVANSGGSLFHYVSFHLQ